MQFCIILTDIILFIIFLYKKHHQCNESKEFYKDFIMHKKIIIVLQYIFIVCCIQSNISGAPFTVEKLFNAVKNKNLNIIQSFVHQSIATSYIINKQDKNGNTALMLAASNPETVDIALTLLKHPFIDDTIENNQKQTAYTLAAAAHNNILLPLLSDELISASATGDLIKVQQCLTQGHNPDTHNVQGLTPLIAVTKSYINNNQDKIVCLLLIAGANPNIQDNNLYTALHHATINDNEKIVGLLLNAAINANIKNYSGHTAYDMAKRWNATKALKLLPPN